MKSAPKRALTVFATTKAHRNERCKVDTCSSTWASPWHAIPLPSADDSRPAVGFRSSAPERCRGKIDMEAPVLTTKSKLIEPIREATLKSGGPVAAIATRSLSFPDSL